MDAALHGCTGFSELRTFEAAADFTHGRASKDGVLGPHGIRAWCHTQSGVRVARFSAPGPLVSLSIFVGTEPINNAGHPHTLEHIIFLGSVRHPQRGYLDSLACRSLGEGTNAYTANEYTCYTAVTAGAEGMMALMPCFVDHVLRPTKTADAEAFSSEVYHCRPDGKEAGVVFSEMKARELTEPDMLDREMRNALLQNTFLLNESGGMCGSIRKLTPVDIDRYHKHFYCGANVSLVIGGSVTIADSVLLDAVRPILDEYASQPGFSAGKFAWQEPLKLPPLVSTVDKRMIHFPCPDASIGSVSLAWRWSGSVDVYRLRAAEVLLEYLATLESSPLQQRFVMTEEPEATDVHYEVESYLDISTVSLMFEGVQHLECDDEDEGSLDSQDQSERTASAETGDTSRTGGSSRTASLTGSPHSTAQSSSVEPSFLESGRLGEMVFEFLERIVSKRELPGGLEGVRAAAERFGDEFLADVESDAHTCVPDAILSELIYGHRSTTLIGEGARGYLTSLTRLRHESEEFWLDLVKSLFLDQPRAEIYMIPDPSLADELAAEEEADQENRKRSLGGNMGGTRVIPEKPASQKRSETHEALELPPRPSTENIPRLSYSSSLSCAGPFTAQTVSVDSGLVHASIVFSTASLSFEQKLCLPMMTDLLLSMDLRMDDGSTISYVDSSKAISEACVSTDSTGVWLGKFSSANSSCFGVSYAASEYKFDEATRLVLRAIFHGEVTSRRLSSIGKQAESDVVEGLRDPGTVKAAASTILPRLMDGSGRNLANFELSCLFSREPVISFIADEYSREKGRPRVRRRLLQLMNSAVRAVRDQPSSGVYVQFGGRDPAAALHQFEAQWADCWHLEELVLPQLNSSGEKGQDSLGGVYDLPMRGIPYVPLSSSIGHNEELARGIGVSGAESSYLDVRVDCPVTRGHARYGRIRVLCEMLSRTEGPLYSAVRGAGFAYGVSLFMSRSQLVVNIDEASLPVEAWEAVTQTLVDFRNSLSDETRLQAVERDVDTAKSTILYGLVANRSTPAVILEGSLNYCTLGLPAGPLADRALEESIEVVDIHGVREVYDEYLKCILRPSARLSTLSCKPAALASTMEQFLSCSSPIWFQGMAIDDCVPDAVSDVVNSWCK